MTGGVSHVDTFDPKPRLFADHGKEIKLDHPEITQPARLRANLSSSARSGSSAARRERDGSQHAVPAHRRLRRRHRPDPVDAHRALEPLQRDAGDAHGLVRLRAAEPRRLGQLRPGHARTATCRRSSSSRRPDLRGNAGLGQSISCRAPTRGRWSSPVRSRWRTSRRASRPCDRQELELAAMARLNRRHLATVVPTTRCWPPGSDRSRRRSGCRWPCRRRSIFQPGIRRRPSRSTACRPAARRASPGNAWSPVG